MVQDAMVASYLQVLGGFGLLWTNLSLAAWKAKGLDSGLAAATVL